MLKSKKKITKIIVVTSNHKSDDKLVKYLKEIKVEFLEEVYKNVAKRFFRFSIVKKKNFFLRVSGDSPLIDYKIVDQAISIFKKNKRYDLVTNIFPRSFPKGQSVEIVKTSILKKNILKMSRTEKEHVTKYFYKYPKKFYIKNFINKLKIKSIKLAVDNKADLTKILGRLDKKNLEIIQYMINAAIIGSGIGLKHLEAIQGYRNSKVKIICETDHSKRKN